jgi:VWFA-related protein
MKISTKHLLRTFSSCIVAAALAGGNAVWAQIVETQRVDTNLVLIDVLVVDREGKPVTGLQADQFELFIDKVKQPVDVFSANGDSVSFGFVYDMHPTTDERTRMVISSLREFKRTISEGDDVFLLPFNMRGSQIFDFIPTEEQLGRHMADPDKREPRSLYDAVYSASNKIALMPNRKRAVILITDGADHQSRSSFSKIRDKLAAIRAEVYAVVLDDDNFAFRDVTRSRREIYPVSQEASSLDRAKLLGLTMQSGGAFFSGVTTAERLTELYQDIDREMHSQYTLGFYPDLVDQKSHTVKVRLKNAEASKAFVLTYRNSYQNPRN